MMSSIYLRHRGVTAFFAFSACLPSRRDLMQARIIHICVLYTAHYTFCMSDNICAGCCWQFASVPHLCHNSRKLRQKTVRMSIISIYSSLPGLSVCPTVSDFMASSDDDRHLVSRSESRLQRVQRTQVDSTGLKLVFCVDGRRGRSCRRHEKIFSPNHQLGATNPVILPASSIASLSPLPTHNDLSQSLLVLRPRRWQK